MPAPDFVLLQYSHHDRPLVTPRRWRVIGIGLGVASLLTVLFFPVGALSWLVPLVAFTTASRYLQLGPRYLLMGKQLVYYANLRCVRLSHTQGSLVLIGDGEAALTLRRKHFVSNARKPEKIAKNKAAKFEKTAQLIIERVRLLAPDAVVEEEPA